MTESVVADTPAEPKTQDPQEVSRDPAEDQQASPAQGPPSAEPAPAAAPQTQPPEQTPDAPAPSGSRAHPIEFLSDVELRAAVELGRAILTIGEVLQLAPGSVIALDKLLGDPVDLMVNDRLIARGEVVVVDEKFGLRITEILSEHPL